ncbi:MAG: hypothetical protein J0I20_04285 [Chloroflexi bacterium]|nr:hypothetical protein [Chloroflexota bacterium]OJW04325.1 MAG: hypothetical protein BGO39_11205 [Chloroflexi bacterium 54-19]
MKRFLLAGWLPNWLSHPALLSWLALVITVSFLSGLVYIIEQQNLRQAANDPQIQMAEDVASSLASGKSPWRSCLTARWIWQPASRLT